MQIIVLSLRYLAAKPLAAALNLLLLGLGLASLTFLLLLGDQLDRAFERDLAHIDVVVGAKGSPLQLILSGVFHLDTPTGNVPLKAVMALQSHPQIASVIPVSLGDSFKGFRVVGTTLQYPALYGAQLAQGAWWAAPMQVVIGSQVAQRTGLKVGDRFAGTHGLGGGGQQHADEPFVVSGVLKASGGVLDRLVLTATESVWEVHEHQAGAKHDELDDKREVTLALLHYKSPLAAASFPRYINTSTPMQAAAPALEITRLLNLLGVGLDVMRSLAAVLLLTAGLSVFIALWNAVRERRADLALLRLLGASPFKVGALLVCESAWLAGFATLLGLTLGQGLMAWMGHVLRLEQSLLVSGWQWPAVLWAVPGLAAAVAMLAALLPAVGAYRVNVAELLG